MSTPVGTVTNVPTAGRTAVVGGLDPAMRGERVRAALAESRQLLLASPQLASTKVGGSQYELRRLIDRMELYAVVRAAEGVQVVPWSQRARQLSTTGIGRRVGQRLQSMAALFDARFGAAFTADVVALSSGGTADGHHFRYAGSADARREAQLEAAGAGAGYAALVGLGQVANGLAMGGTVARDVRKWIRTPEGIRATAEALRSGEGADVNTSSVETVGPGTMIVFGGWDSAALRTDFVGKPAAWADTLNRFVPTVDHEYHHAVTPGTGWRVDPRTGQAHDPLQPLDPWLEEGLSSVLNAWPGRQTLVSAAMGLPTIPEPANPLNGHEYDTYVIAHRKLLQLAGLDVGTPGGYAAAEEFLQSVPAELLPTTYATAIARQWQLPPAVRDRVAQLIDESAGRHEVIAQVQRLVWAHASYFSTRPSTSRTSPITAIRP